MKRFLFAAILLLGFGWSALDKSSAQAKDYSFENFEVEIDVNQDSTMDITEKVTYRFTGEFSVLERGITLEDYENVRLCQSDPSLQCGGFDTLQITGSKYNGVEVPVSDLDLFITTGYSERTQNIEYAFGPKTFNGDEVTWEISYTVFGGLGFFEDEDYVLFYWNTLPEQRTKDFKKAEVTINFPDDIAIVEDDFDVVGFVGNYNYEINPDNLVLSVENMAVYEDFTVLLKLPYDSVDEPGKINLTLDPSLQTVSYLGVEREMSSGDVIAGLPEGDYEIKFSKLGFESESLEVPITPGKIQDLSIKLDQTSWAKTLSYSMICLNLLSCVFIPFTVFLVFLRWRNKGRDIGGRGTIVPWFKPPEDIRPYLLGSVKDEKVDMVDITSTLIDAAYRGYVKIREISKKKYEFIKLKNFIDLGNVEQMILGDIFESDDTVTTDELKNKFYMKLPNIKRAIYQEMVTLGYFDHNPNTVRLSYIGLGIFSFVIGIVLTVLAAAFLGPILFMLGVVPPVIPPMILVVAGISFFVVGPFMPSKTARGTIIFEKAKGFRMFLHTAERYRLAKEGTKYLKYLTSENFEKYLSYAIVFGVEDSWAKAFKGIYDGKPDWYESDSGTFNSILLANSLSNMNRVSASTMSSMPNSSGSSSGGGWSGGGGFSGGFSGGGGGGGSIGAR
ncbi:DUF2207 domain-containing protein [Candidatus Dojkabacteria bacterium]|nr:DUF2207 domain-containing protein [Candidatus Dojkabacteria bacterium]